MIPRLAKRAANAAGKGIILKYLEFLTNYSKNSSKLKVVYVLTLRVSWNWRKLITVNHATSTSSFYDFQSLLPFWQLLKKLYVLSLCSLTNITQTKNVCVRLILKIIAYSLSHWLIRHLAITYQNLVIFDEIKLITILIWRCSQNKSKQKIWRKKLRIFNFDTILQ